MSRVMTKEAFEKVGRLRVEAELQREVHNNPAKAEELMAERSAIFEDPNSYVQDNEELENEGEINVEKVIHVNVYGNAWTIRTVSGSLICGAHVKEGKVAAEFTKSLASFIKRGYKVIT